MKGIKASSTVLVSESVLKKLTGLDCVNGIDLVAELDLPKSVDFSQSGRMMAWGYDIPIITLLPLRSSHRSLSCLPRPSGLGPQRLLALDAVQDPGNLGTLLRTGR